MIDTLASWLIGTVLVFFVAYAWEVSDDDHGDFNKKKDVVTRAVIMFITAALNAALNGRRLSSALWLLGISINASVAWFFLLFDYTIAWILIRNKIVELKGVSWFDYLGKVGQVDNWGPWRNLTQKRRLWIRVGYFVISMALYIAYIICRS